MNYSNKKKLLGAVAIALSIVFVVGFYMISQKYKTQTALTFVAMQDINENTQIMDEMVQEIQVLRSDLPEGAMLKKDAIIGKYASIKMLKGDYIKAQKLSDNPVLVTNELESFKKHDKNVISLTIPSTAAGVSGALEKGDVVALYTVPKSNNYIMRNVYAEDAQIDANAGVESLNIDGEENSETTDADSALITTDEQAQQQQQIQQTTGSLGILYDDLRFVEVCSILSNTTVTTDKDGNKITNSTPVTISLYVTEEQAKKLVGIEQDKSLHVVFVARGEEREKFISKEELIW